MFCKQIGILNNLDWEIADFSDDMLIEKIQELSKTISKFEMLELYLNEDENGNIFIITCIRNAGLQKLGTSRNLYIHKVKYCDEKEDLVAFKKEAYRIKKFLKSKFPGIQVTSSFNWKDMI